MNDYHKIVKYLEQIAAKNLAKKGLKELPGLGNKATNEVAEDGKQVKSFGYPSNRVTSGYSHRNFYFAIPGLLCTSS